jgi:glycosyltransferase 2 family protein
MAAIIYEQVLSVGVAAALGAAFILAYGHLGPRWLTWLVALLPLGVVVLHPRIIGPTLGTALRRLGREPLLQVIHLRRVLMLAAWYLVAQLVLGVGVWLGVRAVGGPTVGSLAFVGGAFMFSFAVSMLVVVVPSGLGIREGVLALALAQHLPGSVAVGLAVVSRFEITIVELLAVGAFALIAKRR